MINDSVGVAMTRAREFGTVTADATNSGEAGAARAVGVAIVDADLHLTIAGTLADVFEHLPATWRRRLGFLSHIPLTASPLNYTYLRGAQIVGVVDRPILEASPRPNPDVVQREALEACGADVAQVLAPVAAMHSVPSTYYGFGPALVSAFNDYMLDRWITDERLRYALILSPQDVHGAVREIERHAADSRVSSVWLPTGTARLGDRRWDPIYAVAVEHGLPIVSHPLGSPVMRTPEMDLEGRINAPVTAWPEIASLVARGTFERFPDLKVVFLECGFSWLDALVRRMEAAWEHPSRRIGELRRSPSEVIRSHVRISTAPGDGDVSAAGWECARAAAVPLPDVLMHTGTSTSAVDDWPDDARARVLRDNAVAALRI